jgi:probable F420-dependent oxidoreductase
MKIGLSLHRLHRFGFDPSAYVAIARRAEQLGFESLWVGDHLAFPETLPLTYPYTLDGRGPQEAGMPWLDPWITLTYLAAATERLRLGTDIYILPLRSPFVTAKAVSTLDILSKGRVTLGVGVGWCEPEFEAVGQDFHNRGRRCDELIDAIRALWTQDVVTFRGAHYAFDAVKFEPKPVQKPTPPIHYGGNSPVALRRIAERCDGWICAPESFETVQGCMTTLGELRKKAGRAHLPFEVTKSFVWPVSPDEIRRHQDIGVERFIMSPWRGPSGAIPLDQALDEMDQMAAGFGLASA